LISKSNAFLFHFLFGRWWHRDSSCNLQAQRAVHLAQSLHNCYPVHWTRAFKSMPHVWANLSEVLGWRLDLLTTYTHNSGLQAITAPPPQHPLTLFPACYIFISRSLATAPNNADSSASQVHILASQTPVQNLLNWLNSRPPSYNISARTT
jgi:hypothetical protein